jgi:hypothetical protein
MTLYLTVSVTLTSTHLFSIHHVTWASAMSSPGEQTPELLIAEACKGTGGNVGDSAEGTLRSYLEELIHLARMFQIRMRRLACGIRINHLASASFFGFN